jgi:hypothetical protein
MSNFSGINFNYESGFNEEHRNILFDFWDENGSDELQLEMTIDGVTGFIHNYKASRKDLILDYKHNMIIFSFIKHLMKNFGRYKISLNLDSDLELQGEYDVLIQFNLEENNDKERCQINH